MMKSRSNDKKLIIERLSYSLGLGSIPTHNRRSDRPHQWQHDGQCHGRPPLLFDEQITDDAGPKDEGSDDEAIKEAKGDEHGYVGAQSGCHGAEKEQHVTNVVDGKTAIDLG